MTAENNPKKRGNMATRRRGARQKAMQALYQWDFDRNAQEADHIIQQFRERQNMDRVDVEYFEVLFLYATEHTAEIDAEIASHMDRPLEQLDPIERSVLRICCTELKTRLDAPYKVVVNEALEISKDFGADKGYRYINGIADKLAASLRKIEYERVHPDGNRVSAQSQKVVSVADAVKARASKVKVSKKETDDSGKDGSDAHRKVASTRRDGVTRDGSATDSAEPGKGDKPSNNKDPE